MRIQQVRQVDFLFVYENKNREVENICLVAQELRARGYSVHMIETWHAIYHYQAPVDAQVVIAFALYNDDVFDFVGSHVFRMRRAINLQWEQLLSRSKETQQDVYSAIQGKAKQAMHISWGKNNAERLISLYGVNPNRVAMTGHMALDFYKPVLNGYYASREEMVRRFPVLKEHSIYLFISSFSYVNMPEEYLESDNIKNYFDDPHLKQNLSIMSQKAIFEWLKQELPKHPDCVFVYRPHPSEATSRFVRDMEREVANFVVIHNDSVQQWIAIADRIYTWMSTAIAQVYAAHKNCTILRPYPLPSDLDAAVLEDCEAVSTYEEFSASFVQNHSQFPVDERKLLSYFEMDDEKPSYLKVCDACEAVLKKHDFIIMENNVKDNYPLKGRARIRKMLQNGRALALGKLFDYPKARAFIEMRSKKYKEIGSFAVHARAMVRANYVKPRELRKIEKRIVDVLQKNLSNSK